MQSTELQTQDQDTLLEIARTSIAHGFKQGGPLEEAQLAEAGVMTGALASPRATFITLRKHGDLRGCVGSLEHEFPLAVDVARNAFHAAFMDTRFMALQVAELDVVRIEVTLLSPHEEIAFRSEEHLLSLLVPGRDGLVLDFPDHRATFLPQVWEQLPDPREFVAQLKLKAGLPEDYWSGAIKAYRYHAEHFAEPAPVH